MPNSGCESVLYVDDDPDICAVVHATLSLVAGLDVHIARSGQQAIDLAFELRPDLLLMDVMMPGMDGPTAFKHIRASPLIANIPVIFLTAKVLPAEIARFLALGAIGVIGKPFDPLKLGDELFALWTATAGAAAITATPAGLAKMKVHSESLSVKFLLRTRGDAANLLNLLARARAGEASVLGEVERIAHSIHGAAAMLGFPRLSAAGGSIERLVARASASTAAGWKCNPGVLQQLWEQAERLAQEVEAAANAAPAGDGMFADHAAAPPVRGRST